MSACDAFSPGAATSPSQRTVTLQCLFDCRSAYDQPRQVGIKSPNPGTPIQSPVQQLPRQDKSFLTPAGPPHPTSSCGYLNENRWVTARRRQPLARRIALLNDSGRRGCSIQIKVLSFQQSQDLPPSKVPGTHHCCLGVEDIYNLKPVRFCEWWAV